MQMSDTDETVQQKEKEKGHGITGIVGPYLI